MSRETARLYRLSVELGARHLFRHGYLREALVRMVVPLDPARYMELPWAWRQLTPMPGSSVLDLASPKLLAVALARSGVLVTSVDALRSEMEAWRRLAGSEPNLRLQVADGRALPFGDSSFDHAYSISVIEHIAEDGDVRALRELARVVRPGGRLVLTVPHAVEARDEYRPRATYVDETTDGGRHFFQRWYDDQRLSQLFAVVPELRVIRREVVRLQPNLNRLYTRSFPWLVPFGPFYGLLSREVRDPSGDIARVLLQRS